MSQPDDGHDPFTVPLSPAGRAAIDAVRAKRGYTLPYHRMFAASAPELLERYDAFYEALTLAPRVLTPVERETVWATLLAAAREVHGFIHMRRAQAAGLGEDELARAVAIAAVAEGFATLGFAGEHWAAWTGQRAVERQYLALFDAARGPMPAGLAHLAATVAMGARRDARGLALHLAHAFDAEVTREQVCEGLSYLLIPCGGNVLIDAVATWETVAKDGRVPAPY